ncbi:chromosome partitioning protein ParA [Deinococcus piscis]|uniref:Chromosome partitioning protein ParA n=1 Tax=Deinococcus piscis TaxID=394230 RepID=A0ABQ3KAJ3_9DEIO|nr:ParA family protein [Deinococcus piscis]GHG10486.1 chromosome partitioning protein ParA [Deinococcus piscis]
MSHQTRVIMLFIHAGGAGKTSTTRDLGYELARRGKRVLLIDLDPQANLTSWLGKYEITPEQTVQAALADYSPLPEPLEAYGMHLIPSHLSLARTEGQLGGMTNPEGRLKVAIDAVRASGRYDYILLDAPPSLGKMTANAANAADWVIVPLPPTLKGLDALPGVQEMIGEYSRTNPGLKVAMYLVTHMNQTKASREVMEVYQEMLGDQLTGPMVLRPAIYANCQNAGRPIDGSSKDEADARAEIIQATDALLQRVGDA